MTQTTYYWPSTIYTSKWIKHSSVQCSLISICVSLEKEIYRSRLFSCRTKEMKAAKIVVLGGNGFVGQRIVNCALRKQASVVGISRSGAPPKYVIPENIDGGITLKWHKADVFDVASWKNELEGADAVVSCIGAFGSNEFMEKMNGDANIIAVSEALNAGVQRFVYISTVENNLPDFVLKGYVSCFYWWYGCCSTLSL